MKADNSADSQWGRRAGAGGRGRAHVDIYRKIRPKVTAAQPFRDGIKSASPIMHRNSTPCGARLAESAERVILRKVIGKWSGITSSY